MEILTKKNPLTVLDIGASEGIHPRWKKLKEPINAILVEPDPREYGRLKKDSPDYTVLPTALSNTKGEVQFNLCKKQMASSVLFSNMDLLELYPESDRFTIIDTVSMQTNTLDDEISSKDSHIDFIKIDAEASELYILQGATNTLCNVIGLEVESTFVPIRKDQPLFFDVIKFLHEQGFQLIDIRSDFWQRKTGLSLHNKGQIIWADGLFLRSPESFFQDGRNLTMEKLHRIIVVYMAYGYFDLTLALLELACEHGVVQSDQKKHLSSYALSLNKCTLKSKLNYIIPEFRGRGRIYNLLRWLAHAFLPKSPYSVSSSTLGNT